MKAMLRLLAITSASALRLPVMTRRSIVDAGFAVAVWPLAAPSASALSNEPAANEVVPGQTPDIKIGVLDINNSPVADYMQYPGLYPNVAGKVASHGPYKNVKDVFSAAGLTSEEKTRLQKYKRYLVATEPNPLLDPMRGRDPYRAQFNGQPTRAAF